MNLDPSSRLTPDKYHVHGLQKGLTPDPSLERHCRSWPKCSRRISSLARNFSNCCSTSLMRSPIRWITCHTSGSVTNSLNASGRITLKIVSAVACAETTRGVMARQSHLAEEGTGLKDGHRDVLAPLRPEEPHLSRDYGVQLNRRLAPAEDELTFLQFRRSLLVINAPPPFQLPASMTVVWPHHRRCSAFIRSSGCGRVGEDVSARRRGGSPRLLAVSLCGSRTERA